MEAERQHAEEGAGLGPAAGAEEVADVEQRLVLAQGDALASHAGVIELPIGAEHPVRDKAPLGCQRPQLHLHPVGRHAARHVDRIQ